MRKDQLSMPKVDVKWYMKYIDWRNGEANKKNNALPKTLGSQKQISDGSFKTFYNY